MLPHKIVSDWNGAVTVTGEPAWKCFCWTRRDYACMWYPSYRLQTTVSQKQNYTGRDIVRLFLDDGCTMFYNSWLRCIPPQDELCLLIRSKRWPASLLSPTSRIRGLRFHCILTATTSHLLSFVPKLLSYGDGTFRSGRDIIRAGALRNTYSSIMKQRTFTWGVPAVLCRPSLKKRRQLDNHLS